VKDDSGGGVFEVMLLGPRSALLYALRCVSFDRVNSGVRMSGRAIEPRFIQIELLIRHAPNQNRSDLLVSECGLVLDVKANPRPTPKPIINNTKMHRQRRTLRCGDLTTELLVYALTSVSGRADCNFRKEKPENFEVGELKGGLGQDTGEVLQLHRILVVVLLELLPVASMTEIS
jgi:hypothetical protein